MLGPVHGQEMMVGGCDGLSQARLHACAKTLWTRPLNAVRGTRWPIDSIVSARRGAFARRSGAAVRASTARAGAARWAEWTCTAAGGVMGFREAPGTVAHRTRQVKTSEDDRHQASSRNSIALCHHAAFSFAAQSL